MRHCSRLFSGLFLSVLGGGLLAGGTSAAAAGPESPASTVLIVHHAGCVICAPIIQSLLTHTPGVKEVRVSQANGDADVIARVSFDDKTTDPARLAALLGTHGYPAEVAPSSLTGR